MNAPARHHLLLGAADWGAATSLAGEALAAVWARDADQQPADVPLWDAERGTLGLAPLLDVIAAAPADRPPPPDARRAAAADAAGNIYWISDDISDDGARLLVRSAGDGRSTAFWPDARSRPAGAGLFTPVAPPPAAAAFTALAITSDAWLVAGAGTALFAFDLVGGGAPMRVAVATAPGASPPHASLLAAAAGGGLWLLDAPAARLWRLDGGFSTMAGAPAAPAASVFAPADGSAAPAPAAAAGGLDLAPYLAGHTARDLAALPDGRLVVLAGDALLLIDPAAMVAGGAGLVHRQPVPAGGRSIAAGPVRLRAGLSAVRLVMVLAGANQALSFAITRERLVPAATVLPLRQHRGRALVAAAGGMLFDTGDPPPALARWVPVVEQARRTLAVAATLDTPPFDGGLPGTLWDRVEIDACLPPGTRLVVEARASDDPAGLGPWHRQPQPIAAHGGSDLGNHGPAARVAPGTGSESRGSLTLLLQQISGRHAQLRLRLEGDGQAGPQLFALRLHYPRQPWHHRYLPAIYRETPDADDFIGRFLGNMQGISDGIEQRITGFSRLLAPHMAPADALPWLASWFDVALDPAWDDDRRRAFIAHAVRFLAWRGTMHGLESALALGLGARLDGTLFDPAGITAPSRHGVRIVEQYRVRKLDAAPAETGLAARAVSEETARWQAWQRQLGLAGAAIAPTLPAAVIPAAQADAWAQFTALTSPDRQLWQRFLAARWRRIDALNRAHDTNWPDFAAISLPPAAMRTATGAADWADFAQHLLPMARAAHRFAVLLPVAPGEAQDSARLEERRRLASRLIALEKPAHTLFDVRFYFAANRVGEARLGLDTALGQGSRAPELLPPAVLGQVYAGQTLVGAPGATTERERIAC